MSDYSKPIGWWCPACAYEHQLDIEASAIAPGKVPRCLSTLTHSAVHLAPIDMIPVFRSLPTPEPSDDLPDVDTVIANFEIDGGCDRWLHCVGHDRDAIRQHGRWFAYVLDNEAPDGFRFVGTLTSEAEAVLWVVEG